MESDDTNQLQIANNVAVSRLYARLQKLYSKQHHLLTYGLGYIC